jgi:hypothetical protein
MNTLSRPERETTKLILFHEKEIATPRALEIMHSKYIDDYSKAPNNRRNMQNQIRLKFIIERLDEQIQRWKEQHEESAEDLKIRPMCSPGLRVSSSFVHSDDVYLLNCAMPAHRPGATNPPAQYRESRSLQIHGFVSCRKQNKSP